MRSGAKATTRRSAVSLYCKRPVRHAALEQRMCVPRDLLMLAFPHASLCRSYPSPKCCVPGPCQKPGPPKCCVPGPPKVLCPRASLPGLPTPCPRASPQCPRASPRPSYSRIIATTVFARLRYPRRRGSNQLAYAFLASTNAHNQLGEAWDATLALPYRRLP